MKRLEEIPGALPLMDRSYRPIRDSRANGEGTTLARNLVGAFTASSIARVRSMSAYGSQHIALTPLTETAVTTVFSELADIDESEWRADAQGLRLFAYRGARNQRYSHLDTMVYQREYRNTWKTNNLLTVELNTYNGGLNVRGLDASPLQGEANLVNVPEIYEAVAADIAKLQLALQHIG